MAGITTKEEVVRMVMVIVVVVVVAMTVAHDCHYLALILGR